MTPEFVPCIQSLPSEDAVISAGLEPCAKPGNGVIKVMPAMSIFARPKPLIGMNPIDG